MSDKWKMVVLDDDPTGIQTVHGCLLITQWDEESVRHAFHDGVPFFYILTNTRAMTRQEAASVTRSAMEMVVRVNRDFGYRLIIVSRSDSCLRGHFPLETDIMRQVLVEHGLPVMAKTPFCPAFIEAGRVTIEGVHYMKDGGRLVPVSETEFARDNVFSYHTSVLRDYIIEKGATPGDYVIVDAQDYDQLRQFVLTLPTDVNVVIRSSSSLPKAIAGIPDIPLLNKSILSTFNPPPSTLHLPPSALHPQPLFIVGSHVQKTTRQLQQLLVAEDTRGVEIDVLRILDTPEALLEETLDNLLNIVRTGKTPVVFTLRREIRLNDADQRQHLGQQVSDFLVAIVRRLPFVPTYLVAKGGITSHDILTHGLGIKAARVLGQVVPSVPCVMAGQFPYIIFPGNVGDDGSLRQVYEKLNVGS